MCDLSANSSGDPTGSRSVATSILERAKADDALAWERLVALFGPDVYQWCRRSRLQAHDAQNVVQEVFASVFRSLRSFRRDKPGDSFRGWLFRITENEIRDHFHRQAGTGEAIGGTETQQEFQQVPERRDSDSKNSSVIGDDCAVVRRALDAIQNDFDPTTWKAFWRMAVDELSSAEIAEELDMTKDAVRQAKCRVMRRLREELDGLVDV